MKIVHYNDSERGYFIMFRDRLKYLRKQRNVTQEQLASAIGVERSTIGKYEGHSQIMPSDDVKIRIAKYFGVTLDYLLENEPPEETPDSLGETLVNLLMQFPADKAKQLIDIASLPQDQFQRVLDFVAGMKSNDTD